MPEPSIWVRIGGELGAAFVQSFVRVREQAHSFALCLNVQVEDPDVLHRLAGSAARLIGCSADKPEAAERALVLLARPCDGAA